MGVTTLGVVACAKAGLDAAVAATARIIAKALMAASPDSAPPIIIALSSGAEVGVVLVLDSSTAVGSGEQPKADFAFATAIRKSRSITSDWPRRRNWLHPSGDAGKLAKPHSTRQLGDVGGDAAPRGQSLSLIPLKHMLSKVAGLGGWCWCVHDEGRRLLQSLH